MAESRAEKPEGVGNLLGRAEDIQKREITEWRDAVDRVTNYLSSLADQAKQHAGWPDSQQSLQHANDMREVSRQMTQAVQMWNRTREQFEANKAYVDLQNKLIEGWPKSWVADRTFYLGAGLLGGGGIAYAVLGAGAVVDYVLLWISGVVLLGVSIVASAIYDRDRSTYFADVRKRVK